METMKRLAAWWKAVWTETVVDLPDLDGAKVYLGDRFLGIFRRMPPRKMVWGDIFQPWTASAGTFAADGTFTAPHVQEGESKEVRIELRSSVGWEAEYRHRRARHDFQQGGTDE